MQLDQPRSLIRMQKNCLTIGQIVIWYKDFCCEPLNQASSWDGEVLFPNFDLQSTWVHV
jgi:hypothetical protein